MMGDSGREEDHVVAAGNGDSDLLGGVRCPQGHEKENQVRGNAKNSRAAGTGLGLLSQCDQDIGVPRAVEV
jgi:hypothetical protein